MGGAAKVGEEREGELSCLGEKAAPSGPPLVKAEPSCPPVVESGPSYPPVVRIPSTDSQPDEKKPLLSYGVLVESRRLLLLLFYFFSIQVAPPILSERAEGCYCFCFIYQLFKFYLFSERAEGCFCFYFISLLFKLYHLFYPSEQ